MLLYDLLCSKNRHTFSNLQSSIVRQNKQKSEWQSGEVDGDLMFPQQRYSLNNFNPNFSSELSSLPSSIVLKPYQLNPELSVLTFTTRRKQVNHYYYVIWMNQTCKTCSCFPLAELVVPQVNSTEAENQTGKSRHSYRKNVARFFFSSPSLKVWVLKFEPDSLLFMQPRVKGETVRSTRFVNTPALESTTAHVLRASTVTSVKVLFPPCRKLRR